MGKVETAILDLSTASKAIREPINMCEGLRDELLRRMESPVETLGISTGFPCLDKQIDGLVPGTLNVVAARPKMGKSAFLSKIARYAAFEEGIPVLYIDTEMGFTQWRDRQIAGMSNIEERFIKHGTYTKEQYEQIVRRCVEVVEKRKLYHEYMPGYTVDKIVALYKKYKMKHNIGLMVFDYIKEPDSSSIERQRKEYQVLGDVTTKLKDLAGELDIPCLTAVQINREGTVADSDRVARYADIIMEWMYRTQDELDAHADGKAGQYKLVIRETRRGGMTGEKGLGYHFFKEKLIIREADIDFQLINVKEGVYNYASGGNDEIT
jgi:replicative DNA helicase